MRLLARSTPRAIMQAHRSYHRDPSLVGNVFPVLLDNFFPVHTSPDGHCGFHAVSWVLFNNENYHFILRLLSCYVIQENWDYFATLIHDFSSLFSVEAIVHYTAITTASCGLDSWFQNIHAKSLSMALHRQLFLFPLINDAQVFAGLSFAEVTNQFSVLHLLCIKIFSFVDPRTSKRMAT